MKLKAVATPTRRSVSKCQALVPTFYGRDRGEDGVSAKKFKDYEDYVANHQYEEYDYILRNDNGVAVWFVCDHDGAYVTLESAIMDEQDRIAQEETA